MTHLDSITVDELQRALEDVDEKKPTLRLTAAIAYKNGVSQTELAEWYDVQRKTIYNWLRRLEDRPLERAVYDESRSGRPRKLDDEQYARLEATLTKPPSEAGYDANEWNPALVQQHLEEELDIRYSRSSCRRLLNECGIS